MLLVAVPGARVVKKRVTGTEGKEGEESYREREADDGPAARTRGRRGTRTKRGGKAQRDTSGGRPISAEEELEVVGREAAHCLVVVAERRSCEVLLQDEGTSQRRQEASRSERRTFFFCSSTMRDSILQGGRK